MNVCLAKRKFFDEKIYEIASSNKRLQDLMNWIRKKFLPAIEAISYENRPCNTLPDLQHTLHNFYNSAEDRSINTYFLNKIPQASTIDWPTFSKQEFREAIAKCLLSSSPGSNYISQCQERLQEGNLLQGGAWPQQLVVPTSTLAPSGFQ